MNDKILSEDDVMETVYHVLLPAIIKYQAPSTSSHLGEYLLTLALNYTTSEVCGLKVLKMSFYRLYWLCKSVNATVHFNTFLLPLSRLFL